MVRWAVLAMFFANGAVLTNWPAVFPIQTGLTLSESELGLALMGMAVGAGLSIVVPLAFSTAGNTPGLPSIESGL